MLLRSDDSTWLTAHCLLCALGRTCVLSGDRNGLRVRVHLLLCTDPTPTPHPTPITTSPLCFAQDSCRLSKWCPHSG